MPKPCSVEECSKPARARNLCNAHYKKQNLYGDPLAGGPSLAERFWAKVSKTETCWLWVGAKSGDYGHVRVNYTLVYVHRLVLQLTGTELIDGLVVDHLCGVKNCVNPSHLEQVTQAENVRRAPHPGPIGQRWSKNGLGSHEHGPCGTSGPYSRGCRCDDCRGWHNARMAAYRLRKRKEKQLAARFAAVS